MITIYNGNKEIGYLDWPPASVVKSPTPKKYTDSDIISIKNDRDRVRQSPTLYIPDLGVDGVIHILYEYIDNSIDDDVASGIGDMVTISIDVNTRAITVVDNARGIPHGRMLEIFTVLATSGKFNNSLEAAYSYSGGAFGHGAKLGVFLSKWFRATSVRDGKSKTLVFEDGILKDTIVRNAPKKAHGTTVQFQLDSDFLAIDELDFDSVRERLQEKSYCYPNLKLVFQLMDGEKILSGSMYTGKGLEDLLDEMAPDTETVKAITGSDGPVKDDQVLVDCYFGYKDVALDQPEGTYVVSYTNSIKTYDGGTHVDGLYEGVRKFFWNQIAPKLSKRDKELKITPKDITAGLAAVIQVRLTKPTFAAQYKSRLTNPEVKAAVRNAVYNAMAKLKPSTINAMAAFVCRVCRGREAGKVSRRKDVMSAFSPDRIENLARIVEDSARTHDRELFLVEGDSGFKLVSSARDRYNQAVFYVMMPRNDFDESSAGNASSRLGKTFQNICDIVGLVPGDKCDISQMTMKIRILTDGDVDGGHIMTYLLGLFMKFTRPAVEAGMITRVIPPRYSVPDKDAPGGKIFLPDKVRFYTYLMDKFTRVFHVSYRGRMLTNSELYRLIDVNYEYVDILENLACLRCCDPRLLEYFGYRYHNNGRDLSVNTWRKYANDYRANEFRVTSTDGTIRIAGGLNITPPGDFVSGIDLKFNHKFNEQFADLERVFALNRDIEHYEINGSAATVYDIMSKFNSSIPSGVKVYKGLAEMSKDDIWRTCLDPNSTERLVAKFSIEDYERDMEQMAIILSGKDSMMRRRAELVRGIRLNPRILDT